jgi:hypothetical protein
MRRGGLARASCGSFARACAIEHESQRYNIDLQITGAGSGNGTGGSTPLGCVTRAWPNV